MKKVRIWIEFLQSTHATFTSRTQEISDDDLLKLQAIVEKVAKGNFEFLELVDPNGNSVYFTHKSLENCMITIDIVK